VAEDSRMDLLELLCKAELADVDFLREGARDGSTVDGT
jgi:hypothetical protein